MTALLCVSSYMNHYESGMNCSMPEAWSMIALLCLVSVFVLIDVSDLLLN